MSFGARNTLRIRVLRGLGVLATGIVEIDRAADHVTFRWRPVVRIAPVALLGMMLGRIGLQVGPDLIVPAIWGLMYLGLLWWTLTRLGPMYDAVSAEIVAKGRS